MDTNLAFYLISFLNAFSIFGRILPGFIADKTGAFNVQTLFSSIMAIAILAYWTPSHNEAAIITFSMFFGFISGAFISLLPVCITTISPITKIGARFSVLGGVDVDLDLFVQ